jgi:hypothetical protein
MEAPSGEGQGLEGTVVPNVDGWMNGWIKQSYNPNLQLMLNNHAVKTNKRNTVKGFRNKHPEVEAT